MFLKFLSWIRPRTFWHWLLLWTVPPLAVWAVVDLGTVAICDGHRQIQVGIQYEIPEQVAAISYVGLPHRALVPYVMEQHPMVDVDETIDGAPRELTLHVPFSYRQSRFGRYGYREACEVFLFHIQYVDGQSAFVTLEVPEREQDPQIVLSIPAILQTSDNPPHSPTPIERLTP